MMMKKSAFSLLKLLLAVVATVSTAAHADTISFAINNPVQTGAPGSTLTFNATISAPLSNGAPIYLNGLAANTNNPVFDLNGIDPTDFFVNFPISLNPGDSATNALFTYSLAGNMAPGSYVGIISILGGADPDAQLDLADAQFTINVPGTSPVPEPGTWVLLITGTGALAGVVYSRRRGAMSFVRSA